MKYSELNNIYKHLKEILFILDENNIIEYVSPSFSQHLKYSLDELIGQSYLDFCLNKKLDLNKKKKFIYYFSDKDKNLKIFESRAISLDGYKNKRILLCEDITKQKSIEENYDFLFKAMQILSSSLDYKKTLSAVCDIIVERFADWCVVYIVDENLKIQHTQVSHIDPSKIKLAEDFDKKYPINMNLEVGVAGVIKKGKSEFVKIITDEMLVAGAADEYQLKILRSLGFQSYMCVPLISRSKALGAITFISSTIGRHYEEGDLKFIKHLASMAAIAVDNASLYEDAKDEIEKRVKYEHQIKSLNEDLEKRVHIRTKQVEEAYMKLQREIKEKEKTQEILINSEKKLSLHILQTPLGVIEWDKEFNVTAWNPSAEQIFGYTRNEVLGKNARDIIIPETDKKIVDKIWKDLISKKGGTKSINKNVKKDGTLITCEWYNTPLIDKDSNVIGVASLVMDISERELAQSALMNSEKRYRGLVSALQEGIILRSANMNITTWNPSAERIFETSLKNFTEEGLEKLGISFIDENYKPIPFMSLPSIIAMEKSKDFINIVYGIKFKDQHITWVSTNSVPIYEDHHKSPTGVVTSIVDITQRKKNEEDLKILNTKLERSNRELQDFASVASHDLQEPLRKVQAFGDRLYSKYSNVIDGDGKIYLDRMQNAAQRMQILINDLLTFSRITTKAQPFVSVNLNHIVKDVLSDLEISIEESGGTINLGKLPTIDADPVQMRQLFQNLISNALKFRKKDIAPIINISAKKIKRNLYKISVEDNGIGFDEKYLDRIFNIFQRLHTSEYTGTGIGLAVCRKIIDRHHGTITAESKINEGSKFIFNLPQNQQKETNI